VVGKRITVETALLQHPKFKRLRRGLGLSDRETLGALVLLWLAVREVAADGDMSGWDEADVDEAAGSPGACKLLVECGFIESADGHMKIHDWRDHSGHQCRDATRKAADRIKKSADRMKMSTDSPRTSHGQDPNVRSGLGLGLGLGLGESESTDLVTEVTETVVVQPVKTKKPDPLKDWMESFDDHFWPAYPRKVSRADALKSWRRIRPANEDHFNAIMDGLQPWLTYWETKDPEFIPHASTWLNQSRWEERPQ
jgi:hypothetical protein